MIKENLKKTKLEDKAKIVLADYDAFLLQNREKFDFIFLDPPYTGGFLDKALKKFQKLTFYPIVV